MTDFDKLECTLNDCIARTRLRGCSDYERDLRKWLGPWCASSPELRELKIAVMVAEHNIRMVTMR